MESIHARQETLPLLQPSNDCRTLHDATLNLPLSIPLNCCPNQGSSIHIADSVIRCNVARRITDLTIGFKLDGEEVSASLGRLDQLTALTMTQIQLTSIPTQIVHLSSLQYLDLSNNLIQGAIPSTLGTLSALSYLDISSNQLTGQIPNELTQCKSLKLLHLQSNQLNGTLPLFPTALEIHVDGNLLTNLGANNDKFITAGYNCLPKQGPFLRNVNCPVSLGDATVSAVSASSSPPVGAIVGGVIGGLVFVAAVVVVVLFARKSRREETRGSSMMLQPIQTYDSVYSVEAEDDEKSPILPAPPYFNPDEAPVAYYQNDSKSSVAASVSDSSREAGPLPSKDNGYIVHQ